MTEPVTGKIGQIEKIRPLLLKLQSHRHLSADLSGRVGLTDWPRLTTVDSR
jgi:hypothetical protein